jgi:hypothetical protein
MRATALGCSMNSMCGAPEITAKRAPEIRSAIAATISGGEDLSNSPATQSVGTRIAPRRALVSIAAMARQACAHAPTLSDSRRSRAASDPRLARNSGVNQRSSVASRTARMPPRSACAPRSAAITRFSGFSVDGQAQIARALTSCGYLSARCCATMPPKEKPTMAAGANPRLCSNACTSSA